MNDELGNLKQLLATCKAFTETLESLANSFEWQAKRASVFADISAVWEAGHEAARMIDEGRTPVMLSDPVGGEQRPRHPEK